MLIHLFVVTLISEHRLSLIPLRKQVHKVVVWLGVRIRAIIECRKPESSCQPRFNMVSKDLHAGKQL
jgi:hypothetical protein